MAEAIRNAIKHIEETYSDEELAVAKNTVYYMTFKCGSEAYKLLFQPTKSSDALEIAGHLFSRH